MFAAVAPPAAPEFIIEVDTTKPGSASNRFILPLDGVSTYNFDIDWGDTNVETITSNADKEHIYSTGGIYEIQITGTFPAIKFSLSTDKEKLTDVKQWGTIAWQTMNGAFHECKNAHFTASDAPNFSSVTDMTDMFKECIVFNESIDKFNTSNVANMSGMFYSCSLFNQSVASLDTSNATDMSSMFVSCAAFNQPVSTFNTSKVTTMTQMFFNAGSFNQDLSAFDTSKVTDMKQMLILAGNFNQDISSFDIGLLTTAESMLQATGFSTANYDLLLVAWEAQTEQPNVLFNAGTAQYSAGAPATAKTALQASGWIITDGGPV